MKNSSGRPAAGWRPMSFPADFGHIGHDSRRLSSDRNRRRFMSGDEHLERPSFLGKPVPPAFEFRLVTIPPGGVRDYNEAEWRDALVVVQRGSIELETRQGSRRAFVTGDMLCLIGLSLRALHNHGHEPVLLLAVSRGPRKSSVRPP